MKKWIIIILIMLVTFQIATALKECTETVTTTDIPCMIISTWSYPNCNSSQALIYNETPTLILTKNFTNYNPTTRCNLTWNITTIGSYFWNVTPNGDTGRITVEVDEKMMLASTIALSLFSILFIGLGVYLIIKANNKEEYKDV